MPSGTETAPLRARAFSGVRASSGRDLSRSLISSINSMGVIPQTASGENVLMRSATAPTSLPSMYTGLPLMPPATLVTLALPNILATMMSWFGPRFIQIVDLQHQFDGRDSADGIRRKRAHAQRHRAHQFAVNIYRAAAHPARHVGHLGLDRKS